MVSCVLMLMNVCGALMAVILMRCAIIRMAHERALVNLVLLAMEHIARTSTNAWPRMVDVMRLQRIVQTQLEHDFAHARLGIQVGVHFNWYAGAIVTIHKSCTLRHKHTSCCTVINSISIRWKLQIGSSIRWKLQICWKPPISLQSRQPLRAKSWIYLDTLNARK